jgi:hypothetical protein
VALEWRWSYQGEGVTASGAFTTKNAPNADGFYEITGIKGEMNGVAITGLQPGAEVDLHRNVFAQPLERVFSWKGGIPKSAKL